MMSEVVDDHDAVTVATHFGTPLHVFEGRKRVFDLFATYTPCIRGDDHGKTVQQIELAEERSLKLFPRESFAIDRKLRQAAAEVRIAHLPLRVVSRTECFHCCEKSCPKRRDDLA